MSENTQVKRQPFENPVKLPFFANYENPTKTFFGRVWSWITRNAFTDKHSVEITGIKTSLTHLDTAQKIVEIAKVRLNTRLRTETAIKQSSSPLDYLRSCLISDKSENEKLKEEIGHVVAAYQSSRKDIQDADYTQLKDNINTALVDKLTEELTTQITSYLQHVYKKRDRSIPESVQLKIVELLEIKNNTNKEIEKYIDGKIGKILSAAEQIINPNIPQPSTVAAYGRLSQLLTPGFCTIS